MRAWDVDVDVGFRGAVAVWRWWGCRLPNPLNPRHRQ